MTTTIEHAEKLEVRAVYVRAGGHMRAAQYMDEAAQRLRELDKPDCVWVLSTEWGRTSHTLCSTSFVDTEPSDYKFCPNCGGAVKEST